MATSLLLVASLCSVITQKEETEGMTPAFKQDLARLAALRHGRDTQLRRVDQLGQELLQKYSGGREQGAIYYQLAHIHAQSGLREPDRVIAYASKALAFPLDPSQRMRMYVYWGDAARLKQGRSPTAAQRKEVALTYLQGLKETSRYQLPDTPPELPGVSPYDVDGPPAVVEKARQEHKREMDARKEAEFQREMIQHRKVLTQQLVDLYSRKPYATEELEQLARQILGDPAAVERLMKALPPAVEKDRQMQAALDAKNAAARKKPLPAPASAAWAYFWLFISGTLVVLAILSLFYWRRRQST